MVRISLMRNIRPKMTTHEFLTIPRTPHIFSGQKINRLSRRNPNLMHSDIWNQFSYSNARTLAEFSTHNTTFGSPISYEAYSLPILPRQLPKISVSGTMLFALMFRKLRGRESDVALSFSFNLLFLSTAFEPILF